MSDFWETWLSERPVRDEGVTHLYCLPHAGGGVAMYHRWKRILPSSFQVLPVRLPGREDRIRESAISDLNQLIESLLVGFQDSGRQPMAFFGHSMGGLIAFQLSRRLQQTRLGTPKAVFVSAIRPPHLPKPDPMLHTLGDEELIETALQRYGSTSAASSDERQLMRLMLGTIRSDFEMLERFTFHPDPQLDCPIYALGGADDIAVSRAELAQWEQHTASQFQQRLFPGGHFYLREQEKTVISYVKRSLERL